MKKTFIQVVVLATLVGVLAGILAWRYRETLWKPKDTYANTPATVRATKAATSLATANTQRRLQDGSFNPLPTFHPPLDESPRELLAKDDWRARYAPFLEKTKSPDAPKILVYPFLDLTQAGIGMQFTYGWRLAAQAALEHWTNARMINHPLPHNFGMPTFDDLVTTPTLAQWKQRALDDPAARDADYVLTGWYEQQGPHQRVQQQIVLLPKNKSLPQSELVIIEQTQPHGQKFPRRAKIQRETMKALAEKLIEQGVLRERPSVEAVDLKLEKELDQVAVMLDAKDMWAVEDGIERALQLAAIYPNETMPLQAACLGINALNWMQFIYYEYPGAAFRYDYALRVYALSQLAMAIDPKPSLSHLNWLTALKWMDHESWYYRESLTTNDDTESQPELELCRRAAFNIYTPPPPPQVAQLSPHWLMLAQERRHTEYYGHSSNRDYFDRSHPHWKENDFFFHCYYSTYANRNYEIERPELKVWQDEWKTAQECLRGTIPTEIAATLAPLGDSQASEPLRKALAETLGVSTDRIKTLAQRGDYYGLRELFYEPLNSWQIQSLEQPGHPIYRVLGALTDGWNALEQMPEGTVARSGYDGFEFTPWDRIQLRRRGDHLSFDEIHRWRILYGDTEGAAAVWENYRKFRPDNINGQGDLAYLLAINRDEFPNANQRNAELTKEQMSQFPLNPMGYVTYADTLSVEGEPGEAKPFITAYLRANPQDAEKDKVIGDLLARFGCNREAISFYDKVLEEKPERYDVANDRAWRLCIMGQYKDPSLRKVFATPTKKLPGNSRFHKDNLAYLSKWIKDYEASKQALEFFQQCKPDKIDSLDWAELELAFGNKDKALEYVKMYQPTNENPIGRENEYSKLGEWALDLGQIPLAEDYLNQAQSIGAGTGGVMLLAARLGIAKKNYSEAIKHAQRYLYTYGPSPRCVGYIAYCLQSLNEGDKAIQTLEKYALKNNVNEVDIGYFPKLMEIYSYNEKKTEADRLWKMLLAHRYRDRTTISDTAAYYEKLNPEQAKADWTRIDEIMAGPAMGL